MNIRTKIIQYLIATNEAVFFYPKLRKFYRSQLGNKPVTIIDVGVNKGQSIDFFLKISKKLRAFGFEPNKKLYAGLLRKYSGNADITIINKGMSSEKGTLLFHENIMDETSTFESLNYESAYLQKKARILGVKAGDIIVESYETEVTTLSDFLSGQDCFYDVLKIDVEGHELSVLKGLFSDDRNCYPFKFIQLESHNDDMYLNTQGDKTAIKILLQENGFEQLVKIKHGFGDFSEIIYKNKHIA